MKKIFLSFTIATMMVSIMSCGNSSRQRTGDMESTAVENVQSNVIENDYLTATLPDGWEKLHVYDRGFSIRIKDNDGDSDKAGLRFEAFDTDFDLEGWVKHMKMDGDITDKIDDVSIGGIIFQQYADKRPSMPYTYFVSYSNKGSYRFELAIFNEESKNDPSVKQLLESIKFK